MAYRSATGGTIFILDIDFCFLLAVLYRFAFFASPDSVGVFFLSLVRESDVANDHTEPRLRPGNSLATVEW